MRELSDLYPRWGYRRMRVMLARDVIEMGVNRAYRLWKKAGLQVPKKRRRRRLAACRPRPNPATGPNQVRAYDFVFDACANGPPRVDCMAPGICRSAFYLSCSDENHAEVVEPAHHGSFTNEPRAGSSASGGWAPLRELRSYAQEQVEVTWTWTGSRYERSTEVALAPPTPALIENEGAIGLPAISEDGRRIALVRSWGTELEGLGTNYEDFQVYRVRDGRLLRTIRIFVEGDDGESTLSPTEQGRAYRSANALLSRGDFHAMARLEPLDRGQNPILDASGAGVRVTHCDGIFHVTGDVQVEHAAEGRYWMHHDSVQ